jgi:hypothetical protein
MAFTVTLAVILRSRPWGVPLCGVEDARPDASFHAHGLEPVPQAVHGGHVRVGHDGLGSLTALTQAVFASIVSRPA